MSLELVSVDGGIVVLIETQIVRRGNALLYAIYMHTFVYPHICGSN
jgi:hypothetical protein